MMRGHRLRERLSLVAAVTLSLAATSDASVRVWNGGDGQWHNSANWAPSGIPSVGDDVVFSNILAHCTVSAIQHNMASITVLTTYNGTNTFLPN